MCVVKFDRCYPLDLQGNRLRCSQSRHRMPNKGASHVHPFEIPLTQGIPELLVLCLVFLKHWAINFSKYSWNDSSTYMQIEAELRPRSGQRYTAIMITWRRERDAGLAIMPICVFTPMIQIFSRCSYRHSDRAPPQGEMMS